MEKIGFWEALTPRIENVYHMEIQRPSFNRIFKKKKTLTVKERLENAVVTSHNRKHKDGRIYLKDKSGEYGSHSISPYSQSFLENIEDGVKDLVAAFAEKGFMPITSCAGHALGDKRHVTLCFSSGMELLDFKMRCLAKFKKFKFKDIKAEDFLNMEIVTNDYGYIEEVEKKLSADSEQISDYMSAMFLKRERKWYMLEIQITDDLKSKNPLKWVSRYAYELFLLDRQTKKFTEFIKNLQHQEEYFAEFCTGK